MLFLQLDALARWAGVTHPVQQCGMCGRVGLRCTQDITERLDHTPDGGHPPGGYSTRLLPVPAPRLCSLPCSTSLFSSLLHVPVLFPAPRPCSPSLLPVPVLLPAPRPCSPSCSSPFCSSPVCSSPTLLFLRYWGAVLPGSRVNHWTSETGGEEAPGDLRKCLLTELRGGPGGLRRCLLTVFERSGKP